MTSMPQRNRQCKGSRRPALVGNDGGSVLLLAMLLMAVLSLLAMGATRNTGLELKIASNSRASKSAFYAAEAGISYVVAKPGLYGSSNVDPDTPLTETNSPAGDMSFSVSVAYDGALPGDRSLRGSGYSAGEFRAHSYRIESQGRSVADSLDEVQVLGFRIGF
ncbi:MAG: pilus assembly PilX N-terminal domain-containing protein [Desulfuromonadales bacterium]